ncbi:MAG TPA: ProQ/FinO family protein [Legionellaceae bacterium]|nr:ProQ/FinO family protein [Legionellaceae bacterium]
MRKQVLHPRTAAINQKQKNYSKKYRLDALHWLQVTFPAAFDNSVKIQPLNLGIMKDILQYADQAAAQGISKSKLREAVVLYTRRLDYLACLKARDMRIDLFGNPSEIVSIEDAEHAALKMKKRVEKTLKNARKSNAIGGETTQRPKPLSSSSGMITDSQTETMSAYTALASDQITTKIVAVKHKSTRMYDPTAVARLKEKLGISQKSDTEKV